MNGGKFSKEEPTMVLRWIRRSGRLGLPEMTDTLQQLWAISTLDDAGKDPKIRKEWRDVPVEKDGTT